MKKCFETNTDIYQALFQMRSTPLGPGLLSLTTLLFNRPARGLLPKFSRQPILSDKDGILYAEHLKQ